MVMAINKNMCSKLSIKVAAEPAAIPLHREPRNGRRDPGCVRAVQEMGAIDVRRKVV